MPAARVPSTVRSLCIVGLDDYPLLSGAETGDLPGGGEAVQHALLARAWRDLGIDVSVIVRDHGQGGDVTIDGIRLLSAFPVTAGIPGLRFFHPRATGLLAALRRANADVYYQSPASAHTGITGFFCRRAGKRFVFRVASDANCIPGGQLIRYWRDRRLYEYGLRSANLVVAQTAVQQALLLRNYGIASEVLDMAVEPPGSGRMREPDIDVLWVGNCRDVKRPELALEIARGLPHLKFAMLGGPMPGKHDYYAGIMAAARTVPNLDFVGPVPYARTGDYFDRASVLLNTSSMEGFPNTFLQAWVRGVPVVSWFDPDGLIERQRLGARVSSVEEAITVLGTWLPKAGRTPPDLLETHGRRALEYAGQRYAARRIACRYLDLLNGTGPLRILQMGPDLAVRGGVSSVERLIAEELGTRVDFAHVATMEECSPLRRVRVFLAARRILRRELKERERLIVHIHFASRGSTLRKMLLAREVLRSGRPLVLHAHGAAFDRFHRGLPAPLRRRIDRVLQRADRLIALSSQWQRFYVEECGVPANQVAVLHNPVRRPADVPDRSARTRVQILFLGRIGDRKGAFDLLAAFRSLPVATRDKARLVMAGDGRIDELREQALDVANVEILAWVNAEQRDDLLAASDVFALPSHEEGVPMALLEAMAWGLPVLTTPVGGIPDIVSDQREGILIPPGNREALAAALKLLIEDDELRQQLGTGARRQSERFDVHRYADQLLALYQGLLPEGARAKLKPEPVALAPARRTATKWQE